MANILPALINGKSYEWSDITLNIMGVPIVGITSIEYGEDQDMMNNYGAGNLPVSRGYGRITPTAKITLYMEEVENIITIAPLGRLQNIPEFDIIVSYVDLSLTPRVHKLRNVRFKNNMRTTKEGDQSISVDMELVISNIEWS
jgi:hypothetical protein